MITVTKFSDCFEKMNNMKFKNSFPRNVEGEFVSKESSFPHLKIYPFG